MIISNSNIKGIIGVKIISFRVVNISFRGSTYFFGLLILEIQLYRFSFGSRSDDRVHVAFGEVSFGIGCLCEEALTSNNDLFEEQHQSLVEFGLVEAHVMEGELVRFECNEGSNAYETANNGQR